MRACRNAALLVGAAGGRCGEACTPTSTAHESFNSHHRSIPANNATATATPIENFPAIGNILRARRFQKVQLTLDSAATRRTLRRHFVDSTVSNAATADDTQQQTTEGANAAAVVRSSGETSASHPLPDNGVLADGDHTATTSSDDLDGPTPLEHHHALHAHLRQVLQEAIPVEDPTVAQALLREAKTPAEVRRILENVVYRFPLAGDVLNGHGFRVAIVNTLTAVAPRCGAVAEWFDCVGRFRLLGYEITRNITAEGLGLIRAACTKQFNAEGRTPFIVSNALNRLRTLLEWCYEDRQVLDHVVYARVVFILAMVVSYFDRQNLYRASFPDDFYRRDGIVVEWVLASERCVDYDQAVKLCNDMVDDVLERLRRDIPGSRPTFSFAFRLMDYYFASDQPEKMLAVMEDAEAYGLPIAESSTAKLLQIACAFNLPNVPELLLKYRALPPQCVLAAPDMSRLLFYYGRAGGGRPCPECGEPYNHRHVGLEVWQHTTAREQQECSLLALARSKKSELEDRRDVPQCQDHSSIAFQLWDMSVARSIAWGHLEWRGFLLCVVHTTDAKRAMEALALVDQHLPEHAFDEFLRQTYLRVLRHHHPEGLAQHMHRFLEGKRVERVSPIVLQEALMVAACMRDGATRLDHLRRVWALVEARDSYVVPYTSRFLKRQLERRMMHQRATGNSGDDGSAPVASTAMVSAEEHALLESIIAYRPRSVNLLDVKDGVSDFVIGSTKKNVFVQSQVEREARDARDRERERSKQQRGKRQQHGGV